MEWTVLFLAILTVFIAFHFFRTAKQFFDLSEDIIVQNFWLAALIFDKEGKGLPEQDKIWSNILNSHFSPMFKSYKAIVRIGYLDGFKKYILKNTIFILSIAIYSIFALYIKMDFGDHLLSQIIAYLFWAMFFLWSTFIIFSYHYNVLKFPKLLEGSLEHYGGDCQLAYHIIEHFETNADKCICGECSQVKS